MGYPLIGNKYSCHLHSTEAEICLELCNLQYPDGCRDFHPAVILVADDQLLALNVKIKGISDTDTSSAFSMSASTSSCWPWDAREGD